MDTSEKLLTAASSVGLLMELKSQLRNGSGLKDLKLWPGIKLTFFSSVILCMFVKWLKKRKITIPREDLILMENVSSELTDKSQFSIKILYGSVTGKSKYFAEEFSKACASKGLNETSVVNMKDYDPEDNLFNEIKPNNIVVIFVSTYTDGTPPESAKWFYKFITEMSNDFRYEKGSLKGLKYSVCGLGNSLYDENFNKIAKDLDKSLNLCQAERVAPLYCCDENTIKSKHSSLEGDYEFWKNNFFEKLQHLNEVKSSSCCGATETCCKQEKKESVGEEKFEDTTEDEENEDEDDEYLSEVDDDLNNNEEKVKKSNGVLDLEDLGTVIKKIKTKKPNSEPKEMITPLLRKSLEKQGYKLIGTHSGVKLCRWTKSMLRGRGGCYKHTFYGIESHRCMETTPSLACANKCVFCWRHHTNPVGTEWKWKMDDPHLIFENALKNQYTMINEFKGVPGVKKEKIEEALNVKHCALSLVGEPIMYPEINTFIDLLHSKKISSFLVTNAQFPDAIRNLKPVTQLYVSVDAPTKESLKRIDRPLFKDYWQRYLDSLTALNEKRQRTVYRLTLVKGWNTDDVQQYAKLISLGKPDFIEIKGVTYCGESSASSLTMQNVPWYDEILNFVKQIQEELSNEYEITCEHQHSMCLLLAHKKFKINNEWYTFIDYDKFQELVEEYDKNGTQFTSLDYIAKTPSWALFGSKEAGFDPNEERHMRKKKKDITGC
ncbi:unnamed protein product [Brachionus calyciflorus]|uniref:S-adenosyl-L-methionine-dependent tRNA 4-demethylwyosine synthase TYW1 n=1 Tax=Brachionus calyciflorus TaxID=104777 RepID=A0A813QMP9_9BILA|nr:unnamed protein product [Brachionus calyciflorus]